MSQIQQQPSQRSQQPSPLTRLDSLQFSRWHLFMVLSLGLVWMFDGYEVSILSLLRKYIIQQSSQNSFKALATCYQVGCILGSLIFGVLAYIIGRKKIFIITLIIYAIGITISIVPASIIFLAIGRFLTGISVGGQFTAIFTAVDQFLPPKYRGRVNIGIDGTWHLGGAIAAITNIIIGQTQYWRLLFLPGLLGILSLLLMRRNIPQSPRWLLLKEHYSQADKIVKQIEHACANKRIDLQNVQNFISQNKQFYQVRNSQPKKRIKQHLSQMLNVLVDSLKKFRMRFFVAFVLMFSQAFFFNLIYYKYPGMLEQKYHLGQRQVSIFMLPLSLCSFISTLFVGPYFDSIGRKVMLLVTFGASGLLLFFSQWIQQLIVLQTFMCVMFCFTSPAGSSANLVASQIFPTSSRTIILFLMFIVGIAGGIFGIWINTIWVGSFLMLFAGVIAFIFCPSGQNQSLQQIQKIPDTYRV